MAERDLMDLRECLSEAVKNRDCCKDLADILVDDFEEISGAHESKLVTLRTKLDQRGPASLGMKAKCVWLRS